MKIIAREFGIQIYPESPLENDMIKKWAGCDVALSSGCKSVVQQHIDWEHDLRIDFIEKPKQLPCSPHS